jgi:hypothetical protein
MRPIAARPARAARIVAAAAPPLAPTHTNGRSSGAGAAQQPAAPQAVTISEPVTITGPVQIEGVLPPAAGYQAVSLQAGRAVVRQQRCMCTGVAQPWRGAEQRCSVHGAEQRCSVHGGVCRAAASSQHQSAPPAICAAAPPAWPRLPRPFPLLPSPAAITPLSISPGQIANAGAAKAAMPWGKTLLLGVVAGVYVGLCAALLMTGVRCQHAMPLASSNSALPAAYRTSGCVLHAALLSSS